MIGLDTNVLIRYITRDDPAQTKRADEIIESTAKQGDTLAVPSIVLCEMVWVLGSAYRFGRPEIAACLDRILRISHFHFEDKALLWQALADYQGGKADFADYLIGRIGHQMGCAVTATFDTALKSSRLFRVL